MVARGGPRSPTWATPVEGGDAYTLCTYDTVGGTSLVALRATIPPRGSCSGKACWRHPGTTGFGYADKELTPDGVASSKLKAGESGRASLTLKAKGSNVPATSLPRTQAPAVTAQLRRAGGPCWETGLPAPARQSDATRWKDAAP